MFTQGLGSLFHGEAKGKSLDHAYHGALIIRIGFWEVFILCFYKDHKGIQLVLIPTPIFRLL